MKQPSIPFEHDSTLNRISCPQCGAKMPSAYLSELSQQNKPLNHWKCDECRCEFETTLPTAENSLGR